MAFEPIKKRALTKARPAPSPGGEILVPGLAGEALAAGDQRAELLALVPQDCRTADDYLREINNLWRQTKARFLLIGKYLLAAKAQLPHGEYEKQIEQFLPFSPPVARQIRAVAAAVYLEHRLAEEETPSSYSVAYQVTTLSDEQLTQAREEKLIGENLKRSDIFAFKRRHATTVAKPIDVEDLIEERRRLLARIADIDRELEAAGVIEQ